MRALLLTLLVAIPVAAQVFMPARRITPTAPVSSDPTPPLEGLAWWWVSEDMADGEPVTNWVDRIRGAVWENDAGLGTTTPTNTSTGVFFSGAANQFISTSIEVVGTGNTNVTIFMILRRTGAGNFQSTLSEGNSGARVFEWSVNHWRVYASATLYLQDGDPGTGWFDWAVTTGRDPSDFAVGYTNAVPYSTNASYIMSAPQTFTRFGHVTGEPFTGYFRELMVYTNAASTGAVVIAQMHSYATNKYGYTP